MTLRENDDSIRSFTQHFTVMPLLVRGGGIQGTLNPKPWFERWGFGGLGHREVHDSRVPQLMLQILHDPKCLLEGLLGYSSL